MDLAITTLSSRGQIVLPQDMRKGLKQGEKLVIIRSGKHIILKRVKDMDKNLEDDLAFARKTEEAWKRHAKGEFTSLSEEEFLKELDTW